MTVRRLTLWLNLLLVGLVALLQYGLLRWSATVGAFMEDIGQKPDLISAATGNPIVPLLAFLGAVPFLFLFVWNDRAQAQHEGLIWRVYGVKLAMVLLLLLFGPMDALFERSVGVFGMGPARPTPLFFTWGTILLVTLEAVVAAFALASMRVHSDRSAVLGQPLLSDTDASPDKS